MNDSAPELLEDHRGDGSKFAAYVVCPNCSLVLGIDNAQFRGYGAIDCADCEYRESHSFVDDDRQSSRPPDPQEELPF